MSEGVEVVHSSILGTGERAWDGAAMKVISDRNEDECMGES